MDRRIAAKAPEFAPQKRSGLWTVLPEAARQQTRIGQNVAAAIEICRSRRRRSRKDQRAPAIEIADAAGEIAQRDNRAGYQTGSEILARCALNHDHAATEPIARAGADSAANDDTSARHAGEFAGKRPGEEIAGVAANLDMRAKIPRPGMGASRTRHGDAAAFGETAKLRAHVALDMNGMIRQQFRADEIEAR